MVEGSGQDVAGYDDLEVYRTLATDELQLELILGPGEEQEDDASKKRSREEAGLDGGGDQEAERSEEEDDNVHVVLCDQGPKGGSMSYYLGKQWERPALADGDALADDARAGAIVPVVDGALVPSNRAEVIEQDEDVEGILGRIEFQMDSQELADTPWRQAGANLQDHFNFGLDEKQWKEYVLKQVRMRLEARQRRKIGVVVDGSI